MKATIDIPDDLYRKVKAKSALEGRPVRQVAIELLALPSIALVGLRQGDRRAVASSWTFFLTSVVSTAVTLMGMALLYGSTGTLSYAGLSRELDTPSVPKRESLVRPRPAPIDPVRRRNAGHENPCAAGMFAVAGYRACVARHINSC